MENFIYFQILIIILLFSNSLLLLKILLKISSFIVFDLNLLSNKYSDYNNTFKVIASKKYRN